MHLPEIRLEKRMVREEEALPLPFLLPEGAERKQMC